MLTVSRQRSDSAKDSIPSDVGIEMGNLEWHHSRELEELRLEEIVGCGCIVCLTYKQILN